MSELISTISSKEKSRMWKNSSSKNSASENSQDSLWTLAKFQTTRKTEHKSFWLSTQNLFVKSQKIGQELQRLKRLTRLELLKMTSTKPVLNLNGLILRLALLGVLPKGKRGIHHRHQAQAQIASQKAMRKDHRKLFQGAKIWRKDLKVLVFIKMKLSRLSWVLKSMDK